MKKIKFLISVFAAASLLFGAVSCNNAIGVENGVDKAEEKPVETPDLPNGGVVTAHIFIPDYQAISDNARLIAPGTTKAKLHFLVERKTESEEEIESGEETPDSDEPPLSSGMYKDNDGNIWGTSICELTEENTSYLHEEVGYYCTVSFKNVPIKRYGSGDLKLELLDGDDVVLTTGSNESGFYMNVPAGEGSASETYIGNIYVLPTEINVLSFDDNVEGTVKAGRMQFLKLHSDGRNVYTLKVEGMEKTINGVTKKVYPHIFCFNASNGSYTWEDYSITSESEATIVFRDNKDYIIGVYANENDGDITYSVIEENIPYYDSSTTVTKGKIQYLQVSSERPSVLTVTGDGKNYPDVKLYDKSMKPLPGEKDSESTMLVGEGDYILSVDATNLTKDVSFRWDEIDEWDGESIEISGIKYLVAEDNEPYTLTVTGEMQTDGSVVYPYLQSLEPESRYNRSNNERCFSTIPCAQGKSIIKIDASNMSEDVTLTKQPISRIYSWDTVTAGQKSYWVVEDYNPYTLTVTGSPSEDETTMSYPLVYLRDVEHLWEYRNNNHESQMLGIADRKCIIEVDATGMSSNVYLSKESILEISDGSNVVNPGQKVWYYVPDGFEWLLSVPSVLQNESHIYPSVKIYWKSGWFDRDIDDSEKEEFSLRNMIIEIDASNIIDYAINVDASILIKPIRLYSVTDSDSITLRGKINDSRIVYNNSDCTLWSSDLNNSIYCNVSKTGDELVVTSNVDVFKCPTGEYTATLNLGYTINNSNYYFNVPVIVKVEGYDDVLRKYTFDNLSEIDDFNNFKCEKFDGSDETLADTSDYVGWEIDTETSALKSLNSAVTNKSSDPWRNPDNDDAWCNTRVSIELPIINENCNFISFDYRLSSENNYDYMRFYVDDEMMFTSKGTDGMNNVLICVDEGSHTFKWDYRKDGSVAREDDCVWIDNITISNRVRYVEPEQ